MRNKKALKLLLRIFISIIFIVFLLYNTDTVGIIDSIAKTNHKILLLGVLIYILGQMLSAYKWKLLAEVAGFKNKLTEYMDYYFIGMFFNLFLPTTVGGDITKCYYLTKGDPNAKKAPAIYSVLADRYIGVIVIVWMATITMFFPVGNEIPQIIKLLMVLLSLSILIVTPTFPSILLFFKKRKMVRRLFKDIKVYWQNPKLIVKAGYWSLLFHLLIVGIHITIGQAMGLNIPLAYYLIVYPMSAIAGFLPVTFNGIGPREGTYIYFFALLGIKSSAALAFGIYWFGIVLISSLVGGIFYIKGKKVPPPEELELIEEEFESILEDFDEHEPAKA